MKNGNEYMKRLADEQIKKYLQIFGAVYIVGTKYCGKTWTSMYHANSSFFVADPKNNFQNRRLASISPNTILDGDVPRLIDEWQEVPSLWDAVRTEVDLRGKKGQFILTGSSTPNYNTMHTGTGRVGRIRMRTMSLYESNESNGMVSLKDVMNSKNIAAKVDNGELEKIAYYVVRGGFPANINFSEEEAIMFNKAYVENVINSDMQKIDNVERDTKKVRNFLRSLARNESTVVSNTTIAKGMKEIDDETIDLNTVNSYLDVLNRLYLIDNQEAFSNNIRSSVRLKQSEKRHFVDPSIACALLNVNSNKLINDLNTFDFLFEALCERDLRIYAEVNNYSLYHYQDYNDREIDAVIQDEDGNYSMFEIKLGMDEVDNASKKLIELRDSIKESGGIPPKNLGVIVGVSSYAYRREDGVYVIPITSLKP